MDPVTFFIGLAMVLFGIFTSWLRLKKPEKLGKLKILQEKCGEVWGSILHIIAYTLIPIIAGTMFIVVGLKGYAIF